MGEKDKLNNVRKEIEKRFNINFKNKGIELSKLNIYLNENFTTETFVSYKNTVDNGYFQIINTFATSEQAYTKDGQTHDADGKPYTQEVKTPHAVLLVGYNSDGSYIVLDPLTGKTKTITDSDIRKNPPHPHYSSPFSSRK